MNRRTLILGGTGFIGLQLARRLAQLIGRDDELLLVDNFSRGRNDADVETFLGEYPSVRLIEADLMQPAAFESFKGAFDHVYLLASMLGVHRVETQPEVVMKTNTLIILNTLEWMVRSGSKRIFFSSTSENYAGGYDYNILAIPTAEDTPLVISDIRNPRFSYAVTKIWGEAACIFYGTKHGFSTMIGRYHNVYGPRMGFDHVVPQLTERILRGENPLQVYGSEQRRAFCYVSDAVEATRLTMEAPANRSEIVHIGNDREEILIGDLAKLLLALARSSSEFVARPAPRGSVPRRVPALGLLRGLTRFEPTVSFAKGLAETFKWYEKRLQKDNR